VCSAAATSAGVFLASLLTATLVACGTAKSTVRIRNLYGVAITGAWIGDEMYGNIGNGETTRYHTWAPAYEQSPAGFWLDGRKHAILPINYDGPLLGKGYFTFVIRKSTDVNGNFRVELIRGNDPSSP
jgi:hypothetical protein